MKWVTRDGVKVGRIASSWLIRNFVDSDADIVYVPADQVPQAIDSGAIPFHVRGVGVQFTHRDGKTPFEAILETYELVSKDPALGLLGRIVNGADTDNRLYQQQEGPGVRAVTDGLRGLGLESDEAIVERGALIFDALYAYCRQKTASASSR